MTFPGTDTGDQPLIDAWDTPGWNAQTKDYVPALGSNVLTSVQFPAVTTVTITKGYFDLDQNPLGGFLTFMPSDNVTITQGGTSVRIPARLAGVQGLAGVPPPGGGLLWSEQGSGKIFIWAGLLEVGLIATDTVGLTTDGGGPLTYAVTEHMLGGRQFTITVPKASATPVDLDSLIVSNSVSAYPFDPSWPLGVEISDDIAPSSGSSSSSSGVPTFSQEFASATTVTVNHNLNGYPDVIVMDSGGNLIIGNVQYASVNSVVVTFSAPASGTVICNA